MTLKHSEILPLDEQQKSVIFRIIELTIVVSSLIILITLSYIFFLSSEWVLFFSLYFLAIFMFFIYSLLSPTIAKRESFQIQIVKIISTLAGLGFTVLILMRFYDDQAVIFFLKGMSLQNLIRILENLNFSELSSYFYFIILYLFLFFVNLVILKKKIVFNLSNKQETIFSNTIDSFKEGALIFPVAIMIVFPFLLQIVLPLLIIIIVLVELLLPFILIGELYRTSENNLLRFINQIRNERKFRVNTPLIMIFTFPIGIFVILESGLRSFFNLVDFNLLWENPDSLIALQFWNMINNFFSFVSFNTDWLVAFYAEFKYYFVTFIILAILSQIYLFLKHLIRIQFIKQTERFILTYD